jgi:DNA-binding transcriptional LysR family regulator
MSIAKYEAFLKAVEHGSFTRAAQLLGYTQSGVSHMIHDLEEEWGVSLLERDRSGVRITSDGLKLMPLMSGVFEAQRKLLNEVDELHDLRSGLIRIGTFSSVATHWLPNMIKTFQAEYPNIEFELLLGDYFEIENWVAQGRVDCGFVTLPVKADLDTVFLEEDPLLAILPEGHPLANEPRFPLKGLEGEPFMLLEKGGKSEISGIFERHKLNPDIKYITWDDYAIMSMVENGLGISILPGLILKRVPYRIVKKELEVPAFRRLGIALRDARTAPLSVKRFMDYLKYRAPEARA